ncbi:prolipoprotein diacylglyceryl transferase [Alicyclobacillus dauci]|uniref:Prolipoprotein diacylglyceryl transferase n=1 Tax=Alicyclobacillus dauci TaxID=1475485 RepID=A0ABY6YYW1_9BACL|nr:prolipoprotein diacylglyceryl transferase family protein [Alicyclobacillus dauci]WAH35264.1 prolipoprotein diacylglyceryl transferase [Alicyclobacillus dauci]
MHFPVYIHIGPWTLPPHPVFESLAYFIGARLYFFNARRSKPIPFDQGVWVLVGAVVGAATGAKILSWLENPIALIHNWSNPTYWIGGETIVGGLLGGLVGVEVAKKCVGWKQSTGDSFVLPLIVGMCIGRVGCFLAGLPDHTYGTPTHFVTGVDFGDGVRRHPTQLYEIAFLIVLGMFLWIFSRWNRSRFPWKLTNAVQVDGDNRRFPPGTYFQMFMAAYLGFRLLIEFIKPTPHVYFGFSNIQLACIAGLGYYIPKLCVTLTYGAKWRMEVKHAQ